ncbi:serine protease [Roseobacter sp. YSTF-M11]|uniref:Serine protease n=1 Tax=Roseobacter insulae TaxID=2859783 RepID=A0A9X1FSK0_9RHOB|nr:serine protease [Roseobacter insulae]MBW4706893.1 serine protease [Roseobacter insulae]
MGTFAKLVLLVALLVVGTSGASRAEPHEIARPSLIFIETKGTAQIGPNAKLKDEIQTQATGFVITDDGFILTSHHLLDEHIKFQSLRLSITGVQADYDGDRLNLTVVEANPFMDLVLLKARLPHGETLTPMKLGNGAENLTPSTKLYTSGFPGPTYQPDDGYFVDDQGTTPHLKQVKFSVENGQSGSPVYLEDGTVIGVVKGSLKNSDTGAVIPQKSVFVPIELAASLTSHIRLKELEQRNRELSAAIEWLKKAVGDMGDDIPEGGDAHSRIGTVEDHIEAVASNFNWNAEIDDRGDLRIEYRKLLGGEIQIENIGLLVTPLYNQFAYDASLDKEAVSPIELPPLIANTKKESWFTRKEILDKDRRGVFIIDTFREKLNKKLAEETIKAVPKGTAKVVSVDVTIVPFTEPQQERGAPVTLAITCELSECLNK